jgi:succinate-semialdehyde dehydrogenase/glutarate-semialdehyde dehydrogenase
MGSLGSSTVFADGITLQNAELLDGRGLIDGAWTSAKNDKTFEVYEPSTGKVLGLVSNFGEDDFVRAIRSADTAFLQFSRSTTAKERAALLTQWERLILKNTDDCKFPKNFLDLSLSLTYNYQWRP